MSTTIRASDGWAVRFCEVGKLGRTVEVFTSPDGTEYVRCSREHADLVFPVRGLSDLTLRRRDWRAHNLTGDTQL